ncbi:MAG: hypothetical protein U0521_17600 [Anaerolineae bacterium]
MSWDDSPTGDYQDHSQAPSGQRRVHYLELKYPIDLTAPLPPDSEGDTGVPLLSFWEAFEIDPNASIRVQYTTDANDEVPDNWIDIPNQGVLIDAAHADGREPHQLTMHPVEIVLSNITVLGITQFRLRASPCTWTARRRPSATAGTSTTSRSSARTARRSSPVGRSTVALKCPATPPTGGMPSAADGARLPKKGGVNGSANAYADDPLAD